MAQPTQSAREAAAFLFDDEIVAKPLTPSGLESVKLKNLNVHLKWVNMTYNAGQMYEEAKGKGYVNATPADAEIPGIPFSEGSFRSSGMILMKIDRKIALGAEKHSVLRALNQSSSERDSELVKKNLATALGDVSTPAFLKAKMQAFTPKDLSGLPGMTDPKK